MTDGTSKTPLEKSNAAADASFGPQAADGSTQGCGTNDSWVDIELLDDDDKPVANARFEVYRPDGELLGKGRLDAQGCGGFEKIAEGLYEVCFPDLDKEAWEPA